MARRPCAPRSRYLRTHQDEALRRRAAARAVGCAPRRRSEGARGRPWARRLLLARLWTAAALALLGAFVAAPALAHFSEGTKVRTVIVASGDHGGSRPTTACPHRSCSRLRSPRTPRGKPFTDPFVRAEALSPGVRYRLSLEAISADPEGWKRRLAGAHEWRQGGRPLTAQVLGWRVLGREPGRGFGSAEEARAALASEGARLDPVFGDAVVEVALSLDAAAAGAELSLRAALPPGVTIDNHLRDGRGAGASRVAESQLQEWTTLDGSRFAATRAFVWQGIAHTAEGPDHVLLVVCIALGAGSAWRLARLVTAFTLGHAVTLAVSFLGHVPRAV